MKSVLRTLLFALLVAALPLRGYAGVLMALCEGHHGGAVSSQDHAHEHERGESHHHEPSDGDSASPEHAASVCSVCASCCASAGLASEARHGVAFQSPDSYRIPFFGRQVSGFVPEHLDRPPLAL